MNFWQSFRTNSFSLSLSVSLSLSIFGTSRVLISLLTCVCFLFQCRWDEASHWDLSGNQRHCVQQWLCHVGRSCHAKKQLQNRRDLLSLWPTEVQAKVRKLDLRRISTGPDKLTGIWWLIQVPPVWRMGLGRNARSPKWGLLFLLPGALRGCNLHDYNQEKTDVFHL